MDNDLWMLVNFQQGINPCSLMLAALTLITLIWFKRNELNFVWSVLLIIAIFFNSWIFNCGVLDKYTYSKAFNSIVPWVYVLLSLGVGILGWKYLKQWFLIVKKQNYPSIFFPKLQTSPLFLLILIFFLGFIFSMLAALWPVSNYVSFLGIYMLLPGQLITMATKIAIYTFTNLWLMYLVVSIIVLENKNLKLFSIISAAILLSASIGVIDLFL